MEEERQSDLRVPLISGLFFILCLSGGILLIWWLLDVQGSQPWFPILALALISFPWIFWFLTYIYTLIKLCFRRGGCGGGGGGGGHSISKAGSTNKMNRMNSSNSNRQVQFGAVVVMDGAGESSVASSKECEMPLTQSVSS